MTSYSGWRFPAPGSASEAHPWPSGLLLPLPTRPTTGWTRTMLDRIRAEVARVLGADDLSAEQARMWQQMTALERRQLELDTLTAELEARVAILEGEHADDALA